MSGERKKVPAALVTARLAPAVLEVLRTLDAAGHRSWVVGGTVRDLLLDRSRPGADVDVATPARPEQVTPLFRKVVPTGIDHGTVTVVLRGTPVEVTTFRGEGAYLDGRRPSSITFLDDVDADLARRDFTVNALAWDPLGPAFRDPFDGQSDLRRGLLRAVGDPVARFAEDGLRPMRAARLSAQLGFELDPATAAAIPGALAVASRVSVERFAEELSRLLLAPHAREGLRLLEATGLLALVLPELADLSPELRAHAFDSAVGVEPELASRLAALLHVVACVAPAGLAAAVATARLTALRLPRRVAVRASALVAGHGCLLAPDRAAPPASTASLRRWLAGIGRPLLPSLLGLWRACARSSAAPPGALLVLGAFEAELARVEATSPPLATSELALGGREVMAALGVSGGPEVGAALRHLLERVLDEPALNTREALTVELEAWRRRPGRVNGRRDAPG